MKKFNLFLVFLMSTILSCTLVACGDDEEEETDYKTLIIGKWMTVHSDEYDTQYVDSAVIQFNSTGKLTVKSYEVKNGKVVYERTTEGTYQYSGGNTISITRPLSDEDTTLTTSTATISFPDKNTFKIIDDSKEETTYHRLSL